MTNEEYALIAGDLTRAGRFLHALESGADADVGKVIREALTLAAIVSYCRPFIASFDAGGQRRLWIPQELVDDLPAVCRTLHKRLLEARHQAWAHTDWKAHTPRSYSDRAGVPVVVSRNPWVAMSPSEIAEFQKLLREVDIRLRPSSAAETLDQQGSNDS